MNQLVMAGAGHAHALVLLDLARQALPDTQVTVVSPQALAPYSGMVPGWLAGAYRFDEIVIDFEALCARAGVRWVCDEIESLDPSRQELRLTSGQSLGYDLLSLNVGSTLTPPRVPQATVLSMRPLSALRVGWEGVLAAWQRDPATSPRQITVVGGGAAGFESLLAAMTRLRGLRPDRPLQARLVSRGSLLVPGVSAWARRAALRTLHRAGVDLQLGTAWTPGQARPGELVLWATGAQAQAWQRDPARRGALAVSGEGFVRIDAQLRSVSHPQILAAGDCAQAPSPLPKAGVYAVRMGPVLAHNLRAALSGGSLLAYEPQRHFLALLATGDGRAIASRGFWGGSGRWAWRWKDHIDRGFVDRFARQDSKRPI